MAEYIEAKDVLNQGRQKINDFAIAPALRAEKNSEDAKKIATAAEQEVVKTQEDLTVTNKRIDNLVLQPGDSTAEVADSRLDTEGQPHEVLSARLAADFENRDVKIGNLFSGSQTALATDIDGTDFKAGQLVDVEQMRYLQSSMYYQFLRTLRYRYLPILLKFLGDSLTYGSDVTNSRPGTNGSDITRATTTYPEAVMEYLNQVYINANLEGRISIDNLGYPGDWAPKGYERNATKSTADLTIIMYGTNDSRRASYEDAGKVDVYLYWLEQIVIRELLWGNPVLLMTPPKTQNLDIQVDAFREGIKGLADKYNIPLLDATQIFESYSANIYSDATHFHDTGYKVLGSRVAASLIGAGPHYKQSVYGGSILLARPTLDNVVLIKNAAITGSTGAYAPAPNELDTTKSVSVLLSAGGGRMIYSFYCAHENTVAMPYFLCSTNGTVKYTLDFGVSQSENSLDTAVQEVGTANLVDDVPNTLEYSATATTYGRKYLYLSQGIDPLRINQKGWHTLTVENSGASVAVHGIEFFSFHDWDNLKRIYALENNG